MQRKESYVTQFTCYILTYLQFFSFFGHTQVWFIFMLLCLVCSVCHLLFLALFEIIYHAVICKYAVQLPWWINFL
jgi:hypothetical protein